jgi:hypothetical protein
MSPLSALRQNPLFSRGLHRSSLPGNSPAAVVRSDRQRPALGSGQGDHQTVARAYLVTNARKSSDFVSVVVAVPFPCRWGGPSWTS